VIALARNNIRVLTFDPPITKTEEESLFIVFDDVNWADVAKLVGRTDLGSSRREAWRFRSLYPHVKKPSITRTVYAIVVGVLV